MENLIEPEINKFLLKFKKNMDYLNSVLSADEELKSLNYPQLLEQSEDLSWLLISNEGRFLNDQFHRIMTFWGVLITRDLHSESFVFDWLKYFYAK